ncbi:MAG: CDP-diacylglycerol--glycerol-3-phosphate 3-phosphatidyltransferase [Magnetococcales bacterium]|nr:CDP-diacylglycerol--glycerol-3-phosphate 3-phosphatidyltransferase [Magnetococcales bacterium]
MVWNLPNTLTAARIVLIPVFIGLFYLPGRWGSILSTAFFGLAALTDWADGYVARTRGLQTPFGKFFDPVADKLLVVSALFLLVAYDRAPFLLGLIIIAREIVIMALREYMAGFGHPIHVSRVGKWKTGFQMSAILMLLVQEGLWDIPFQLPGLICLYISTILTVYSGYLYMASAWPVIRDMD